MNILILGAEGFIGSHAVKYFKERNYKVTSCDITIKNESDYLRLNPEDPNYAEIFLNRSFDICINASGAANVQFSFEDPALDYKLNTVNVFNVLNSIRQYNKNCKFINLSSAAVYGNPASLPVKESHAVQPLSPYGYHKWYSEQLCTQFYEQFNIGTISVRIFSAYGIGLRKQLFWDLYKKIQGNEQAIELFGTGKESRDFIYIEDIMRALHCIIERQVFNGETINVGSGCESTIEDIVQIFLKEMGKPVQIKFLGDNKIGDPLHWCADISKLKNLRFEPKTSINTGIKLLVRWLKDQN